MNRSEFEELELQVQQSDLPLKLYLQQVGVSYSTYHYWRKKCAAEKDSLRAHFGSGSEKLLMELLTHSLEGSHV